MSTERLAPVVERIVDAYDGPGMSARAEAILREYGAAVLEEASEALDLPGSTAVGYYASEQHSGYADAERDAEAWLTKRAARLRGEEKS